MRRRIICILLCIMLTASLLATVFAFSDTDGHWAQPHIDRVTESGLFNGISETIFAPESPMTRAMFVTVLGRLANVDATVWTPHVSFFFTDVPTDAYYAPYVAWAYCNGITNGTGEQIFSPNENVTRQELSCFIVRFLYTQGYEMPDAQTAPSQDEGSPDTENVTETELAAPVELSAVIPAEDARDETVAPDGTEPQTTSFADEQNIAQWALYSATLLNKLKIVNGMTASDGSVNFWPKKNATRAECATVLCRTIDTVQKAANWEASLPVNLILEQQQATLEVGATTTLSAIIFPFGIADQAVTWYSENRQIADVSPQGIVTGVSIGSTRIVVLTANGLSQVCEITVKTPTIALGLTSDEKDMLVFGKLVDDPRYVYSSADEAKVHMQPVIINVWDINSAGEKVTKTCALYVHENIADRVAAIFKEIYELPEKPPIHTLGGYRASTDSEHLPGLAIDINSNENYYCDPNGKALVGSHFSPETDPYSIPVGGSIDQIFAKYGFTRGIYWRSGYKDYMHYSFYGT